MTLSKARFVPVMLILATCIAGCTSQPTSTLLPSPSPTGAPTETPPPTPTPSKLFDGEPPHILSYNGDLPEYAIARLGLGKVLDFELVADETSLLLHTSSGYYFLDPMTLEAKWGLVLKTGQVVSIAPDKEMIATNIGDNVVVYNAKTFAQITTVTLENEADPKDKPHYLDYDIVWSPDGSRLAVVAPGDSRGCNTTVWDMRTFEITSEIRARGCDVGWSPDSRIIVTSYMYSPLIGTAFFDADIGHLTQAIPDSRFVGWSPSGTYIVTTADYSSTTTIWTYADARSLVSVEFQLPMVWSPDDAKVAIIATGGSMTVWNLNTGSRLFNKEYEDETISDAYWLPDSTSVIVNIGEGERFEVIDAETGNLGETIQAGDERIAEYLGTQPSQETIVYSSPSEYDLVASDANTKEILSSIEMTHSYGHLGFDPDGTVLASSSGPKLVFWDVARHVPLRQLRSPEWGGIFWSPDGKMIADAHHHNFDIATTVWDVSSGRSVLHGEGDLLDWSPDGLRLAVSTGWDEAAVVDAQNWKRLYSIPKQPHTFLCDAKWSPSGETLAILTGDLKLLDAETGQEIYTTHISDIGCGSLDWATEDRLAFEVDDTVRMMDVKARTFTTIDSLQDYGWGFYIMDIALHPSGSVVAAGLWDDLAGGRIALWNTSTGRILVDVVGHSDQVRNLTWSPNDDILASVSMDGTILLWDFSEILERVIKE